MPMIRVLLLASLGGFSVGLVGHGVKAILHGNANWWTGGAVTLGLILGIFAVILLKRFRER